MVQFTIMSDDEFDLFLKSNIEFWLTEFAYWQRSMLHATNFRDVFNEGVTIMAKRNGKDTNGNKPTWAVDFINLRPSADDKKAFDKFMSSSQEALNDAAENLLLCGGRLSITFDGENDCFIVAYTQKVAGDVNEGKCLTVRAGTWFKGFLYLAWYHQVIAKNGAWTETANDDII